MKVAYLSDIRINNLVGEETWLNESFDYFSSIMAQFISRYSDTIDYLILNGGIYSDSTRFLEFVDFLDTSFTSHDIHTKVLFNVSNIEYYSNSVFVDKVGQFYDTDKKFKNHRLYLPRNPIITKDTWIFGVDTWYDYSLYRGKPISLKDITKKDNRGFFGKLFNKRVNLDNFNITDESDYAFGLQNTFDVKHTNDCVDSFRHICDRYDRTIAQPTNKVACGYFYSNALFLSDNPKRDGYNDAFSGSFKFDDTFKSHGITEYVCGKASSYRSHITMDGIMYRNSATTLRKKGFITTDCVLGDVLVVDY
jgi:hypothetical protein